jgi:fatty acid desaturase
VSWYRLPARYRERRAELLASNGGYWYRGYAEVIARYFARPKEAPAHPGSLAPMFNPRIPANDPGTGPVRERVA